MNINFDTDLISYMKYESASSSHFSQHVNMKSPMNKLCTLNSCPHIEILSGKAKVHNSYFWIFVRSFFLLGGVSTWSHSTSEESSSAFLLADIFQTHVKVSPERIWITVIINTLVFGYTKYITYAKRFNNLWRK